ncbi:hypothetical protein BZA77DRAFT_343367 [Pyronema omphalodes]|nr:hypothetical protein BZA77DRAFT_343367 [Pyronema omphalodes]
MSSKNSDEQPGCSSTQASNTPGSGTPSATETMSTTATLTADLQISFPAHENMLRSFQDIFTNLRVELARLEIENKKLVEHNTAIEKELETMEDKNVKLSGANDDAMKKLAEVEEKKDALQKKLYGLEDLNAILGLKRKCEELEKQATENQERTNKLFEDFQKKMEKRIVDMQTEVQQNFEQDINRIKTDHTLQMQSLASAMGFQGLEDMTDGYMVREKPFERIPGGMIQVSRAKATESDDELSDGPPREDDDSSFLYVVRDQYKDFKKFAELAELVFGLERGRITWIKGTKSRFMKYKDKAAEVIEKWEKEASMKDRVYILSGKMGDYVSDTVYYVED